MGDGGSSGKLRAFVLAETSGGTRFCAEESSINKTICADLAHVVVINPLPSSR
jgi:hypothetical protein